MDAILIPSWCEAANLFIPPSTNPQFHWSILKKKKKFIAFDMYVYHVCISASRLWIEDDVCFKRQTNAPNFQNVPLGYFCPDLPHRKIITLARITILTVSTKVFTIRKH